MPSAMLDQTKNARSALRSQRPVGSQRHHLLMGVEKAIREREPCHKTIHTEEMLEDDRPSAALLVGTVALLALNLALAAVVVLDVVEYIGVIWGHS